MDDSTAIIEQQQQQLTNNNDSSNPSGLNLYRKIVLKKKPAVAETPPKDESNLTILPSTTENKSMFPYLISNYFNKSLLIVKNIDEKPAEKSVSEKTSKSNSFDLKAKTENGKKHKHRSKSKSRSRSRDRKHLKIDKKDDKNGHIRKIEYTKPSEHEKKHGLKESDEKKDSEKKKEDSKPKNEPKKAKKKERDKSKDKEKSDKKEKKKDKNTDKVKDKKSSSHHEDNKSKSGHEEKHRRSRSRSRSRGHTNRSRSRSNNRSRRRSRSRNSRSRSRHRSDRHSRSSRDYNEDNHRLPFTQNLNLSSKFLQIANINDEFLNQAAFKGIFNNLNNGITSEKLNLQQQAVMNMKSTNSKSVSEFIELCKNLSKQGDKSDTNSSISMATFTAKQSAMATSAIFQVKKINVLQILCQCFF